ncbi:alpha-1,2-fucosyltransferase [Actinomyces urogenitalis]|uniref:alpha-1,2-fucosyltransferase n=1 Tax=Actinomyces urogenitalis TaxID=103621 RepID=UPI0024313ECA|nr:alpha-1,2-fucosyltransferase [Actinomyces urogenitalis]MCI7455844.1 alpha-1,2-fucosyltransferase [Actinomyces urogenitalis]
MRLSTDLEARMRGVVAQVLKPVRTKSPVMVTCAPELGLANFLYLWLHADAARRRGEDIFVQHQPEMDRWLAVFPEIRELVRPKNEFGIRNKRRLGTFFRYGDEFTPEQLDVFVRERMLTAPLFSDVDKRLDARADDEIAIHVRRGTYYTVPQWRAKYTMDIAMYVRLAVEREIAADGAARRITVYSNDPQWCESRLAFLTEMTQKLCVTTPENGDDGDFRDLATYRRLVLSNSTYSYWAGYVAGVLRGRNGVRVTAPWFHLREMDGRYVSAEPFAAPQWSIIQDIPGGWDA